MSEKTTIEKARSARGHFRREYEAEDRGLLVSLAGDGQGGYVLRVTVPAGVSVRLPQHYQGLKVEVTS